MSVDRLSWSWIALQRIAPPVMALLAAYPFWRRDQPIFGNLVGTAVLFGSGMALIMREYIALDRIIQQCLADGYTCFPTPSAFTRFAIYAFVALFEVIALFSYSLNVEHRMRRRGYAPEWK